MNRGRVTAALRSEAPNSSETGTTNLRERNEERGAIYNILQLESGRRAA